MRAAVCVSVFLTVTSTPALSQETGSADKPTRTGEEMVDLVGGRFNKVFEKFGAPTSLFASVSKDKKRKEVGLDYGQFYFMMSEKTVRSCSFCCGWPHETIQGIKLGDPLDEVVKKLGQPVKTITTPKGKKYLFWDFGGEDEEIQTAFDKDKLTSLWVKLK